MSRPLIIIFIVLSFLTSYSQNLIKDHSFEDSTNTHWYNTMGICYNSPINICSRIDKTNSSFEYIPFDSKDGLHCAYLSLFQCHTNWSGYLINKSFRLERGKRYEFSFYITPSDSSGYFSRQIDIFFGSWDEIKKNIACSTPGKLYLQPTKSLDISEFRNGGSEGKWLKLCYSFLATGSENSLVIGRFFSVKSERKLISTRVLNFKPTKKFLRENFCSADYFVDNFSLVEM